MAMKRTTVFADERDLAIIKAAAARRGVAEAELLRHAIHLAAMAERRWDAPFFSRTYVPVVSEREARADEALESAWAEKATAYEQTKSNTS